MYTYLTLPLNCVAYLASNERALASILGRLIYIYIYIDMYMYASIFVCIYVYIFDPAPELCRLLGEQRARPRVHPRPPYIYIYI